jgi:hypothetical protein
VLIFLCSDLGGGSVSRRRRDFGMAAARFQGDGGPILRRRRDFWAAAAPAPTWTTTAERDGGDDLFSTEHGGCCQWSRARSGPRRVVFIAVRTATARRRLAEDLGLSCFMRMPGAVVSGMVEVAFPSVGVGRPTSCGVSWIPHLVLAVSWGVAAAGENRAWTSVLAGDDGV